MIRKHLWVQKTNWNSKHMNIRTRQKTKRGTSPTWHHVETYIFRQMKLSRFSATRDNKISASWLKFNDFECNSNRNQRAFVSKEAPKFPSLLGQATTNTLNYKKGSVNFIISFFFSFFSSWKCLPICNYFIFSHRILIGRENIRFQFPGIIRFQCNFSVKKKKSFSFVWLSRKCNRKRKFIQYNLRFSLEKLNISI